MDDTPLKWDHAVTDIPAHGLSIERKASAGELAELTHALDIVACERLSLSYRIVAIAGGGYRLSGSLNAHVVQACVVTLEPVAEDLDESFAVEYWPPGAHDNSPSDEIEALTAAEIELLENGIIDAGRIVYEQLAAALNPYPRKPDAEFVPPADAQANDDAKTNPFAVLAKLKPKP